MAMSWYSEGFEERLRKNRKATKAELKMCMPTSRGRHVLKVGDEFIPLDPEDEDDRLDGAELLLAEQDNPYWDEQANQPECAEFPAILATPVRHSGWKCRESGCLEDVPPPLLVWWLPYGWAA
jgi:hypothetical protein